MIQNRQKFLLHHYARAAGLSDPAYRSILRRYAGVTSAAHKAFSQSGFDRVMAALETTLFDRVNRGEAPDPLGADRWIHSEFYWRGRLPDNNYVNARQALCIRELWEALQSSLPPEHRTIAYLAGIIHKATGKQNVGYAALTSSEAGALIDALRDRLAWAAEPQSSLCHAN
jgi:hypothetical protein